MPVLVLITHHQVIIALKLPGADYYYQLWQYSGLSEKDRNLLVIHVTVQYCGREINDDDLATIDKIWMETLEWAQLAPEDLKIQVLPELQLFGQNKDNLVAKCRVSEKIIDIVAKARAKVLTAVSAVP